MMPTNGGVQPLGGARRLTLRYDTLSYALETPDGETVTLAGYRRGAGCPISVEIEVESAWAEWSEDSPSGQQQAELTTHRYLAATMRAERLLRRNLLLAVLPGLEQKAADMLAVDQGPWESILVELGWWQPAEEARPAGEAAAGGPGPSTGSPASPDSSAPTTGSRSRTRRR
jgi:hypothetical protein